MAVTVLLVSKVYFIGCDHKLYCFDWTDRSMKNVLIIAYIHDSVIVFVLRMLWLSLVLENHLLVVSNVSVQCCSRLSSLISASFTLGTLTGLS